MLIIQTVTVQITCCFQGALQVFRHGFTHLRLCGAALWPCAGVVRLKASGAICNSENRVEQSPEPT